MFRSIIEFIILAATALSNGMVSLNHLMRGAVHQTQIIESRAESRAALNALRGETNFITDFAAMQKSTAKIKAADKKAALLYLEKFKAQQDSSAIDIS